MVYPYPLAIALNVDCVVEPAMTWMVLVVPFFKSVNPAASLTFGDRMKMLKEPSAIVPLFQYSDMKLFRLATAEGYVSSPCGIVSSDLQPAKAWDSDVTCALLA